MTYDQCLARPVWTKGPNKGKHKGHIWKLPPPGGPTSLARCSRCKEKREFKNAWEPQPFNLKAHQHRQPRRKGLATVKPIVVP